MKLHVVRMNTGGGRPTETRLPRTTRGDEGRVSSVAESSLHRRQQAGLCIVWRKQRRHPLADGRWCEMTCIAVADDPAGVCANCGKNGNSEGGAVKLKNCNACLLVKYCGVDCQRAHRKLHKKACKQRAAELKDEQLYSQGHERPEGDFCPICTLPIPLPKHECSVFHVCCMKTICIGCDMQTEKRGMHVCPFCRTPCPDNDTDELAMVMARVEKQDPLAIGHLGGIYYCGSPGLQKDMRRAVELWTEAADLGSVFALYNLGKSYEVGEGVEQDRQKGAKFYQKAAMQGQLESRYQLGMSEVKKGNLDRAKKHFLISANMGDNDSLENIKNLFMAGIATKEQYAEALKGYQVAIEEMKSHDREEAKRIGFYEEKLRKVRGVSLRS